MSDKKTPGNGPKEIRVSQKSISGVSTQRRAALEGELENGVIIEKRSLGSSYLNNPPNVKSDSNNVIKRSPWIPVSSSTGMKKLTSATSVGAIIKSATTGAGYSASNTGSTSAGQVTNMLPEVYSPLFTMANMNLPRDRPTIMSWVRNFYLLHPIVRNAINLHATYPISKLNLRCHDKKVLSFFENMVEYMDLLGSLGDISLEFWKCGEMVSGDTLITMSDGSLKKISHINIGDEVLTHSGKRKKVLQTFRKPSDIVVNEHLKIYKVKVHNMIDDLIISGKHPILTFCDGELCFLETNAIRPGDSVYFPFDNEIMESELTVNMCRLIGSFLRIGHLDGDTISFKSSKIDILLDIMGLIIDVTPGLSYSLLRDSDDYLLKVYNISALKAILEKFIVNYQLIDGRTLNKDCMLTHPNLQLDIIDGFIGNTNDNFFYKRDTTLVFENVNLFNQFCLILRRNGVSFSAVKNSSYEIKIDDYEINSSYDSHHYQSYVEKIEEITNVFTDIFMYDLEVEDEHSYVAGIAIHNCFPYAELDTHKNMWKRIVIHNPDYIFVNKSSISGDPVIYLKPDEKLINLINSNNPRDVEIRNKIPDDVIHHIKKGNNIPLDNFNVSHLKMLSSPYDTRGTSIIVSVFKDLMLYDKLRECYSDDTEFLTENGFKKYDEICNEKLATLNPENGQLEYQNYTDRIKYHYDGDMYNFNGRDIDVLVTPNHRMWLSQDGESFDFVLAEDVLNHSYIQDIAKWDGKSIFSSNIGEEITFIHRLKNVAAFNKISSIKTEIGELIRDHNQSITKIPYIVKDANSQSLREFLDVVSPYNKYDGSISYKYSTQYEQLADDLQEVAFKAGYSSVKYTKQIEDEKFYFVNWMDKSEKKWERINKSEYFGFVVCFTVPNSLLVVRRNGKISIQGNSKFAQADGMINPITIIKVGGNADGDYRATEEDIQYFKQIFEEAQYNKDFKLVTHAGVTVERVGFSGHVLETTQDVEQIVKNIYTGLMVPPALIDTESAVYSSASIGLEVLRQRYYNFRNMMAAWLTSKILAPISELQDFYEYVDGEKKLIVPEVEWNKMNLYDLQDHIQNLSSLVNNKQVSLQTLYKSLGLNYQEEVIKMREEAIRDVIRIKEEQALNKMTIMELKALNPEKEILDPIDSKERESMSAETGGVGGAPPDLGGMMPGGGMGELSPPPAEQTLPGGEMPGASGSPFGGKI